MTNKSFFLLMTLTIAVFGVITTEVSVIGLLPQLELQLNITPIQVGYLVSVYAIVVAIAGPVITLLLLKYNRKYVLLCILFIFIVSNIIYATENIFNIMLVFRILPALTHALFFAIALVVAANSVPKEKSADAVATVFSGVALGMVLGMPLSSFIAEYVSLSAAFYFGSVTCLIAFMGVVYFIPSLPVNQKINILEQVTVLKKPKLWLSIATVTLIFSAMFSSFSYISDYLTKITHLSNNMIAIFLILFGASGYMGNFIFSRLLQKNTVRTTYAYTFLFILVYCLVWLLGFSPFVMVLLIIFWGIFHSSGLIVSQTWLMHEASEAPEFANSLYIAFSNLGITLGAMAGGFVISHYGVHSIVLTGILFLILSFFSIYIKNRATVANQTSDKTII
ncbi:MFS transporter [Xenorhabdus bovienii]|uniref:MFS transporter n=1 Tax=Xenorhabdus bovienii TaxID=40576 RepID=UPI0023B208F8|nr:MFS transporter [Xenorhabdus bovienii]MDE9434852.1 MFS transporter [Xenorhabdus bovienii]MDE9496972.1 MFS transporter [Xenorhabdus bovienii]